MRDASFIRNGEGQASRPRNPRFRYVMAVAIGLVLAPALMTGVLATGVSWSAAAALTLPAAAAFAWFLSPAPSDVPKQTPRLLFPLWCGCMLAAAGLTAFHSVFMLDPQKTSYAYDPPLRHTNHEDLSRPFYPVHNCFTGYIVAAHLAGADIENIYDPGRYRRTEEPTIIHEQIDGAFGVDTYQYPPPFLILPRALMATGGDFFQLRAYWHAVNVTLLIVAMIVLVRWIVGPGFHGLWFLVPLMLLAPTMCGAIQIQNVHVAITAMCLLALPAFETRRNWLGGALLGFAVATKLFPAVLAAFLLLRGRWRAVAWTLGWVVLYGLSVWVLFGARPYRAFVEFQLPRLADGEAFFFATTHLGAMLKNASIRGVGYKLHLMDWLADPKRVASMLGVIYGLAVVSLLLYAGLRRHRSGASADETARRITRWRDARLWTALFVLAQLHSPFLPWTYGNAPVLVLALLLMPVSGSLRGVLLSLVLFAWLAAPTPLPWGPPGLTLDVLYTLIGLAATLAAAMAACCAASSPVVGALSAREKPGPGGNPNRADARAMI